MGDCKLRIVNCKFQIGNPGSRRLFPNLQFAFFNSQFAILLTLLGLITAAQAQLPLHPPEIRTLFPIGGNRHR